MEGNGCGDRDRGGTQLRGQVRQAEREREKNVGELYFKDIRVESFSTLSK